MSKMETDELRRRQAANEAFKLLDEAGFVVSQTDADLEDRAACFEITARLALPVDERPLAILEE